MASSLPKLRWGILGTGTISSLFARDLLLRRPNAEAEHHVVAIGSSSIEKARMFVVNLSKDPFIPQSLQQPDKDDNEYKCNPKLFDRYQDVFNYDNVDIVFVGTPHAVHKQNVLDAIAAGKHVLCEKPMAVNEHEVREMIDAARSRGVFLMEGVWTRFFPLITELQRQIHDLNAIGDVQRVFLDYGMQIPPADQQFTSSSLKKKGFGAGSLLDVGIYNLTWASLILGQRKLGAQHPQPRIACVDMDLCERVDENSTVVLKYNENSGGEVGSSKPVSATAILTTTLRYKTGLEFCTIEGSTGNIKIAGLAASCPLFFSIGRSYTFPGLMQQLADDDCTVEHREAFTFHQRGTGYYYEADAVAVDISCGRTESSIMPLDESLRVMQMMDEIRHRGGVRFPQDKT